MTFKEASMHVRITSMVLQFFPENLWSRFVLAPANHRHLVVVLPSSAKLSRLGP